MDKEVQYDIRKHNWRPLPKYLKIQDSKIEGQGLFTQKKLLKDQYVGVSHYYDCKKSLKREALGAFINHSDNNNCTILWDSEEIGILITTKEIEAGEELTLNYGNEICGI